MRDWVLFWGLVALNAAAARTAAAPGSHWLSLVALALGLLVLLAQMLVLLWRRP